MGILDDVRSVYDRLPLAEREARAIALACTLEPLAEKAGCVTRTKDQHYNTLEMFIAAGVNVFPAYLHLAQELERRGSPRGMYRHLREAVLLSKAGRRGGQINLGILEFTMPIVAAHVLHDPRSEHGIEHVIGRASDVLRKTGPEDVQALIAAKQAARAVTQAARNKRYPVMEHDVPTVYDYYLREHLRERDGGHPTGVVHNRQFVEGFPDIRLAVDAFQRSAKRFSDRLADAYGAVMAKPANAGIGPGLGADFTAAAIYLALTYGGGAEIVG